ncbi:DUF4352 domain-containing protein [Saccharomonospora saliphila]|uniref:DUF4352 domain-containing protein n=1 Tax=Saccharomonospora saliphila TaxID=369829 RepID=UPI00036CA3E8|nr:DUF4352 domain-containing protein [Saccharomonospora saliphila]
MSNEEQSSQQEQAPSGGNWFARHKILTGVLVVVVLAGIGAAMGGGGDSDGNADAGSVETSTGADGVEEVADGDSDGDAESETVGLNTPARDGKFEFTVSEVDCGHAEVGDEFLGKQAQGQFCLVSMTVENIGDEPQSLFGDNQKLFDSDGREFSADTEAGVYVGQENQTLFEEINPGNTLEGVVVFDIPEDATPATLELHDSAFSGGVEVTL